MKITITKTQFEYLTKHLFSALPELAIRATVVPKGKMMEVTADGDTIDEIREWALEFMQEVGFDTSYEPTDEGKILESIIDAFYQ